MKKILKISLVLAVVLVALNVYGVVNSPFHKKNEQRKMVNFGVSDKNNIDVSVYDANDKLLYTENVNSNAKLVRTYDLTGVAEGIYYLVSESESKITKYEILVNADTATIMSIPFSEVTKKDL